MDKKKFIDNPIISSRVFYPRKVPVPENLPSNIKPLHFDIGSGIIIGGYFFLNDKNLPNILLFHGNGEIALDYYYSVQEIFDCDVNLAVVDFRGYGHSNGEPYYTSLINDATPIYEKFQSWIESKSYNNDIFVFGRSLGSICTAEIGSQEYKNIKGIIFESGFASTFNLMTHLFEVSKSDIDPESIKLYSNDIRIKKFHYPTLIIHGTSDFIIPSSEAHLIYKNLPNKIDKKLVLIEGAGHNNISTFTKEYFDPLCKFIHKHS
jgi:pimeloyl-ACP methyl ester carboxylesterase